MTRTIAGRHFSLTKIPGPHGWQFFLHGPRGACYLAMRHAERDYWFLIGRHGRVDPLGTLIFTQSAGTLYVHYGIGCGCVESPGQPVANISDIPVVS